MLLVSLSVSGYADDEKDKKTENPYKKSHKVSLPKNTHAIYAGVGFANDHLYVMAEKPTSYGNIYAKIGQFIDGNGVAGLAGYRYPYQVFGGGKNRNGVYPGIFAGHVEVVNKDGKRYNRLGAGLDISYLWFDATRISSLTLGIYFPEPVIRKDDKIAMKPKLMIGASLEAGFF